jgi:hypothetical protein
MAQFATVPELADYIGRPIAAGVPTANATKLLQMASAKIQNYCRQRLEAVADDAVALRGTWSDELWLPERPVTAVASIQIGTDPVLPVDRYDWGRRGRVLLKAGSWLGPQTTVAVDYSHGYQVIPDDIKDVCLEAVARAIGNPEGRAQESIGNYSTVYGVPGLELTEDNKRELRRYRPVNR